MAYRLTYRFSVAGLVLCLMMVCFWIQVARSQTVDGLQFQLNAVRDTARDNAADLRLLRAQVERNTADLLTLTSNVTDSVAAMNKLSGIGIAIGALGGIIFIFQSVHIVKQRRGAKAEEEG